MSTESEALKRDFRSSYYFRSLHGYKGGEKSQGHLEALLKMEVLDIEKLRLFCLQHTLPVYCRRMVWKVLLGIMPVYTDKETTKYIEEQKTQQYYDIRHALQVMGKIDPTPATHELEQVAEGPSLHDKQPTVQSRVTDSHVHSHTAVSLSEEFVLVHLLENNRLLSAAENQLKNKTQVRLRVIAEAFLSIFDEEEVSDLYWIFSGFVKMCESRLLMHLDRMVSQCLECLAREDSVLFGHLKSMGALDRALPLYRWFSECFASDLPDSCLESVWDRLIAGSCMVLVFVAVAIILSIKRRILGLTSTADLTHVLQMIPKENFTAIVSKGLQLWESHESPLLPNLL